MLLPVSDADKPDTISAFKGLVGLHIRLAKVKRHWHDS